MTLQKPTLKQPTSRRRETKRLNRYRFILCDVMDSTGGVVIPPILALRKVDGLVKSPPMANFRVSHLMISIGYGFGILEF